MKFLRKYQWLLVSVVIFTGCIGGTLTLRNGERILFLGDSITELGAGPTGYVTVFRNEFKSRFQNVGVEIIAAGISGNKVNDLQDRLNRDVIRQKPSVVIIYIGINDVWHWTMPNHQGSTKEQYESGLREIVARIQYAGAEVVLCTPTVIGEVADSTYKQNPMLNEYSDITRKIAKDLGTHLCDLHTAFGKYLHANNPEKKESGILTTDGVHLNAEGNKFVANELLKLWGDSK